MERSPSRRSSPQPARLVPLPRDEWWPDPDCRSSADGGRLATGVLDSVAALAPLTSTDSHLRSVLRRAWGALGRLAELGRGGLPAPDPGASDRASTHPADHRSYAAGGRVDRQNRGQKSPADLLAADAELSRPGEARPAVTLPPLAEVLNQAGAGPRSVRRARARRSASCWRC
jgi:hypothetical protein